MNAIKVGEGVYALPLPTENAPLYVTLLCEDNRGILMDAGLPGQWLVLKAAVEEVIPFDHIQKIYCTHHDIDHIGCLTEILQNYPNITVSVLDKEKLYIEGTKKPVKLEQLEKNLDHLDDHMKAFYARLKAGFQNRQITVTEVFEDGEQIPFCGGITVIHTPGHVPGHTCYYLQRDKILVAGDGLTVQEDKLYPPNKGFTADYDEAFKSLKKLEQYDIQQVIAYHGGVFHGGLEKLQIKK